MIEALTSLAFSIQSKKGVYALLVGSGVSRSSGIPTGWEIVLDLIHKLAAAESEDCRDNPETWYQEKYNRPANYSEIIDELAKTPSEKNNILSAYIEPTADDIEQGGKIPTQAHKSIAQLVQHGFIKVILTTNFDRLIELALEEIGITPRVISTTHDIEGTFPLQHTDIIIIKLHGDYKDTRIKNSEIELATYDDSLNSLLDRIFDEYGLIICGWSADWDIALRDTISRCNSHRFTTYWTTLGGLTDSASRLSTQRRAEIITIDGANNFFKELHEKVLVIDSFDKPHPLSAKTAVAIVKKLLRDEKQDIYLSDYINEITSDTYSKLSEEHFPVDNGDYPFNEPNLIERVNRYNSIIEILLNVISTGCYWGNETHARLWVKSLHRISNPLIVSGGDGDWINLRHYPALLMFYASGLSSIINEKYQTFASLCNDISVKTVTEEVKLYYYLHLLHRQPLNDRKASVLLEDEEKVVSLSIYLSQELRELFKVSLPSNIEYQRAVDRFEYLLSLIVADEHMRKTGEFWGPVGYFAFRTTYSEDDTNSVNAGIISVELIQEQLEFGNDWWPLQVGFFEGSVERFNSIKQQYDAFVTNNYTAYCPNL